MPIAPVIRSIASSGSRPGPSHHVARGRDHGRHDRGVADDDVALHGSLEEQGAQRVDQRRQVVVRVGGHHADDEGVGPRHQPDAHLGDDPEVRLQEQPVERWSVAALVRAQDCAAGHRTHARPHEVPSASTTSMPHWSGVVAVGGVAEAALEGVADDAAPADVGHRGHQPRADRPEVLVQVEEAHAGLDDDVPGLVVDLEHAVHPVQVDHDASVDPRDGPAVAVVLASGDGPQRDAAVGGDAARPPAPPRPTRGARTADGRVTVSPRKEKGSTCSFTAVPGRTCASPTTPA